MSNDYISEEEINFECSSCKTVNITTVNHSKGSIETTCHHCDALNSFEYEIEFLSPKISISDHSHKPKIDVEQEIEVVLRTPLVFEKGYASVLECFYDAWEKIDEKERDAFCDRSLLCVDCDYVVVLSYLYFQHKDNIEFITPVYDINYQGDRVSSLNVGFKDGEIVEYQQGYERDDGYYIRKSLAKNNLKERKETLEQARDNKKLVEIGIEISEGKRVPDKEYIDLLKKVA